MLLPMALTTHIWFGFSGHFIHPLQGNITVHYKTSHKPQYPLLAFNLINPGSARGINALLSILVYHFCFMAKSF